MFINFIKSKLKWKAFFRAKYLRQRMTSVAYYIFHQEWLEKRKEIISSLFIYSFTHSGMRAFIHSTSYLEHVRHCPRRRNTKVKMVPITEFTVCQGRQMCKQTILASIPLQHCVQNTKMAQMSYTLEVRKQFLEECTSEQDFEVWIGILQVSGMWRSERTWDRGNSKYEAQKTEPAKHGQIFHQRHFIGLRTEKGRGMETFSTSPVSVFPFLFPLHYPRKVTLWFVEIIARAWNWSHCLQLPPPQLHSRILQRPCRIHPTHSGSTGQNIKPKHLTLIIWGWLWHIPPGPWHRLFPSHCPPPHRPSGPRLQAWPACFPLPSFAHVSPTDQAVHPSRSFTSVLQGLAQGPLIWLRLAPSSLCQYRVRY